MQSRSMSTAWPTAATQDRKSTRLNSSHVSNSYAVFCLKKKKVQHARRFFVIELSIDQEEHWCVLPTTILVDPIRVDKTRLRPLLVSTEPLHSVLQHLRH